jgi:hypothetical protein
MSEVERLITRIESVDFFYEMSTISDFRTLRKKILNHNWITELYLLTVTQQKFDDLITYINKKVEDAKNGREVNNIALCAIVSIIVGSAKLKTSMTALRGLIEGGVKPIKWVADYAKYCLRHNTSNVTFTDYSLSQNGESDEYQIDSDISDKNNLPGGEE